LPRTTTVLIALFAVALLLVRSASASDAAYERDLVDRVQAAFVSPHVPAGEHICVSPLLLEIRLAWPNLTEVTKAAISSAVLFDRPVLPEQYDTPDGHFRIHFTRTGTDSVNMSFGVGPGNVPTYVLNCADIFRHVVAKQIDTLGFRFPVSDQMGRPGEDPRFDIYLVKLPNIYYGLSYPDTVINNGPGNAWWATSFMELQSDFTKIIGYEDRPFDAMAVTVAHEFHHSEQWSYDAFEAEYREVSGEIKAYSWWLETSAVAMEEITYDGINDYYGYLHYFFDNPGMSLRAFANDASVEGQHPYASCIWVLYLIQHFHDESLLRQIWEECGKVDGFNTFAAFDTVLVHKGTTLHDAWAEFLVWNYFTGTRTAPWSYEEASSYAMLKLSDSLAYDEFPAADTASGNDSPNLADEFGASYMRFRSPVSDTATTFRLIVTPQNPDDYQNWMIITAGVRGQLQPAIQTWDVFSTIEVPNWDSYDEILVIATPFVAHPTQTGLNRRLGFYFVVADTLSSGGSLTGIARIYSNPLALAPGAPAFFQVDVTRAQALPASLQIFTIDGREVRGGASGSDGDNRMFVEAARGRAPLIWNGTTANGDPVATGIYLALVRIGGKSELVKVAVKNQMR